MKTFKQFLIETNVTDNPNFQKWFDGSKVVDEHGNPLVVYHGTNNNFNTFEKGMSTNFESPQTILGHFFTPSYEYVQQYGSNIIPVYLNITNPKYERASKLDWIEEADETDVEEYYNDLESSNIDGIVFGDITSDNCEIVAFYHFQIKSATNNNGDFDPNNTDITK